MKSFNSNESNNQKRKYILILIIVCIVVLCFFCLINKNNSKNGKADDIRSNDTSSSDFDIGQVQFNNKVLDPESAVNIYLNNKSVWMKYPEFAPMNGYCYGFLDLDFDGTLELISNINDGTGRYSCNSYYKINTSDYTVSEIKLNVDESADGGGYDYSLFKDYPKLLKSLKDDSYIYYCADCLKSAGNEYQEFYGTLQMSNNTLNSQIIFSKYYFYANVTEPDSLTDKYYYVNNGEYIDISKENFDKKVSEFYSEYEDLNLKWKYVNGKDLELSSISKQKELLLSSYKAFSYTGFSFDKENIYEKEVS